MADTTILAAPAVGGSIQLKLYDVGGGAYSFHPPGLQPSGVSPDSSTLSTSTLWEADFSYVAGRTLYLTLTGSGSGTVTVVYSRDDGGTYVPEASAVDGGAPIILNKIAYAGSSITIPISISEAGLKVGVLPGTITGTVTASLSQ